jgi:hypothetical protein
MSMSTDSTMEGETMSAIDRLSLTEDIAYASLSAALDALRLTHADIFSAPGVSWYREEFGMLATVCAETGTATFHGASYIGASSINTGPAHGRRWVYARLRGDFSLGHVPAACAAWSRVSVTTCWQDARDALTVKDSPSYKVKNFACNVLTGGDVCAHDVACVTMDRHMLRLSTWDNVKAYTSKKVPTGAEYVTIANAMRRLARDVNMTPANLQAILWVAIADRDKSLRCIVARDGAWSVK